MKNNKKSKTQRKKGFLKYTVVYKEKYPAKGTDKTNRVPTGAVQYGILATCGHEALEMWLV